MRAQLWDLYFLNDPEAAYERLQRDFYRMPPLEKDYLQALSYRRLQFKEGLLTDDPKKREITLENLKLIREAQWGKNIRVGDLALFYPEARIQGEGPRLKDLAQMKIPYQGGILDLSQALIDKNGDLDVTAQMREALGQWAPTLVIRKDDEKPIPIDYTLHNGTLILKDSIDHPTYQKRRALVEDLLTDKMGLPLERKDDADSALTKLGFDPDNTDQIARAVAVLGIQDNALWIPPPPPEDNKVLIDAGFDPYDRAQMEKKLEELTAQNKTQRKLNGDIYDLPTLVRNRRQAIIEAQKRRLLVKLFDFDGVELAINPAITDRPGINNRDLRDPIAYASARISPQKLGWDGENISGAPRAYARGTKDTGFKIISVDTLLYPPSLETPHTS